MESIQQESSKVIGKFTSQLNSEKSDLKQHKGRQ
jgi:hypothetical protein